MKLKKKENRESIKNYFCFSSLLVLHISSFHRMTDYLLFIAIDTQTAVADCLVIPLPLIGLIAGRSMFFTFIW